MDFSILTPTVIAEFSLRWIHFVAGITWIGLLYWFNLINVNFQKNLDADLKGKVNPHVIPQTLWYFRWGAAVTVLSGLLYYIIILHGETMTGAVKPLVTWLVLVGVAYAIIFNVTRPTGALNNGNLLALIVAVIVAVFSAAVYILFKNEGVANNASYAIGVGGGIGVFMMLNVWGIIWPAQKRILGLVPLEEGADKAKLGRRAFLASRMNAWLSLILLFFMGAATHLPLIHWS